MKKLFAFDLDGVLIDSLPNMKMSWEIVKLEHKIDVPFSEYEKHIGKPFYNILNELDINHNRSQIKETYDEASNLALDEVKIYPNAIRVLQELKDRGCKIAICTSKDINRVKNVIGSLILDGEKFPKFDYVCSPKQGLRGKPAPDQLLYTMAFCNVDPSDTVYVGDMDTDRQCAERAGVDFIHAEYGYGRCEVSVKSIKTLISLLD